MNTDDERDPALMLDYIHWLEGVIYDCVNLTEFKRAGYPEAMYNGISAAVETRMKHDTADE